MSAQETTGGSTNVDDSTAEEVPQDGMATTIPAFEDDDPPPIPLWQVVDHEKETQGPQLHDGPSGPPCFPPEFDDDSLAKRVENESEGSLSDDLAHDNASTVHSMEEGSVSSRGTAPPTSPQSEAIVATALAELNPPSAGVLPSLPRRTGSREVECTKQS